MTSDGGAWVGALDGGGTKTATALADRGGAVRVLPAQPGCNPQDGPGWEASLRAALEGLARAPNGLAAATLGLPGWGEVPELDAAAAALARTTLGPVPHDALNDVALAHVGALAGGDGVLVLAGTGSMAWARGPGGEARVGGWGDLIGDEGSAHWIGREALALVARILDGREVAHPAFATALCREIGATGPFAPLAWLMTQPSPPRAAIAGVARAVDALAARPVTEEAGPAQRLLAAAAAELGLAARAAAARVGLGPDFSWVPAGGAFRSARLRDEVARRLGPPRAPQLGALGGGLLRAARCAGWAPDEAWARQVDAQLGP